MNTLPVVLDCDCERGTMFKTSIKNEKGQLVAFLLTEDLRIVWQGHCSTCGKVFQRYYYLMDLLFGCPTEWEKH